MEPSEVKITKIAQHRRNHKVPDFPGLIFNLTNKL